MLCTKCKEEMLCHLGEIYSCNSCSMFAYQDFYGTGEEYQRLWDKQIVFRKWMIDECVYDVKNVAVVKRFRESADSWIGEYVSNDSYQDIIAGKLGTVRLPSKAEIEENFYMVLLDAKLDSERVTLKTQPKIKVNKP